MNLLAFLWLVGCIAAVCTVAIIPDEVWQAIAERIRNPKPSPMDRYFESKYGLRDDEEPGE